MDEEVGNVYVLDATDTGILLWVHKRDDERFHALWEEWVKEKVFEAEMVERRFYEVRLLRIEY